MFTKRLLLTGGLAVLALVLTAGIALATTVVRTGTIDGNSPTLTPARLFRDGIPSTCAAPKAFPGTFNSGAFRYETETFQNPGVASCATIAVLHDTPPGNCSVNAHAVAYLNSFDPTNLATNYLGDEGSSEDGSFEVNLPANSTLVVVMLANNPVALVCDYQITVSNLSLRDLTIAKLDTPDPVAPGGNITYDLTVTVAGEFNNVSITDSVPVGTTFVSASLETAPGWAISTKPALGGTGAVIFTKGPAANETATFKIVVKVKPSVAPGTEITNTATIKSSTRPGSSVPATVDNVPGNNTVIAKTQVGLAP